MSKKKRPIAESEDFKDVCRIALSMYATCTSKTKRCFIGGCADNNDGCLVFFRGDVDDVFAVKDFLEKRDKQK